MAKLSTRQRRSVQEELVYPPSPEQIDEWLIQRNLHKTKVGTTLQGRDLYVYHTCRDCGEQALLFLSLVHGNEPLGLLSLLWTAEYYMQERGGLRGLTRNLIFFPIVNLDAYRLNLEFGRGCRRTNLRETCPNATLVTTCPNYPRGGVDLNRNHPMDWNGTYANKVSDSGCSINYKGSEPWSEPESQAIRNVVRQFHVAAAMSFHSRSFVGAKPLLIHPYTSARPLSLMHRQKLEQYREWSKKMVAASADADEHVTGSAIEAIQYTASGSTIDWMHSQHILSFVLESRIPCADRWCEQQPAMEIAQQNGRVALQLVKLVASEENVENSNLLLFPLLLVALVLMLSKNRWWRRWLFAACRVRSTIDSSSRS